VQLKDLMNKEEINLNPIDMLANSKCVSCRYMFKRILKLVTQEDIDYYSQYVELNDLDDYELSIEQYKCLITQEDIEGEVIECNNYIPNRKSSVIGEYKF